MVNWIEANQFGLVLIPMLVLTAIRLIMNFNIISERDQPAYQYKGGLFDFKFNDVMFEALLIFWWFQKDGQRNILKRITNLSTVLLLIHLSIVILYNMLA